MNTKNKLELQWTNKGKALYFDPISGEYEWVDKKDPRVTEPRILIEKKRFGDKETDNILIKGDNLLALKALQQDFQRKIKLIFIDPPYNTGNAFPQYDDGLEHSLWLGLMRTRIESLYKLLSTDGSMWVTIDDDESHYLKVMCDEIFGRNNFVANVIWEKKYAPQNDARWLSDSHDHILVYAKNKNGWRPKPLPRTKAMNALYKNPDNDPRGPWMSDNPSVKTYSASTDYPITTPGGRIVNPPKSRSWRFSEEKFEELVKDNRIWFGKNGKGMPRLKTFLSEVQDGIVSKTIWFRSEVGDNQEAKKEIKLLDLGDVFATPKPERLIDRIVDLASGEGDWVLDSFAGSGTTGAVAHKKGRKWIMVELGNHVETHIIPRMKQVVNGVDKGGITKLVNWLAGGGFKYFELGESLFVRDNDLQLTVINPRMYNGALIRAVLKIEGFKLVNPDNGLHGKSGTTAGHVTEQYLTQEYVDILLNEIGDQAKFLVIYAKTISSRLKLPDNVEVKRIPDVLLKKFSV
jgi:adenine-specific DNA-methyltransferase